MSASYRLTMAGPSDRVKETCDDHINSGDTHDRWRSETRRRGSYPVHNPARPAEIVGHAPAADRAQLDAAVSAARRAAPGWRALDVAERIAGVAAAAATAGEQLTERDGAQLYTREHGKVLSEASFEIDTAPMIAVVLGSMAEAASPPNRSTRSRPIHGCTESPTALQPLSSRSTGRSR